MTIGPAAADDCHHEPVRVMRERGEGSASSCVAITHRSLQLCLVIVLLLLCLASPAFATISYRVSLAQPESHRFRVTMTIPHASVGSTFAIPAWNALYQVRDFAHRIREVRVQGNASGRPQFTSTKLDNQTWRIDSTESNTGPAAPETVVDYSIEWDDPGPFNTQLNAHHAFINLAEILMYVPDRRGEDVSVEFLDLPAGWRCAAELASGAGDNSFVARSYDALVDAPVEVGLFDDFSFESGGARIHVVVDSNDWNKGRLQGALERITGYELNLMAGPPFDNARKEYTFFFHIGPGNDANGGGMEHSNCTAVASGTEDSAIAIAAHEFFHAWNVKRIRPQALEPVDFTKEQPTRALWFAEGVTSTYAAYTLERTGLWSKSQFFNDLANQITELESRPAHKWQSVEESSLDAWFEKYPLYNAPDRSISYYTKGQIDGVLLDLAIRDATENHSSLDDVLRRMNAEYPLQHRFYNESEGIRGVVEEVTGKSFADFFRRYVSGSDDIPYDSFLALAGLELRTQTAKTADIGFWPSTAFETNLVVSELEPGGPAEAAGLRDGDVVLEVNGKPATRDDAAALRYHSPGETIHLRVRRDDRELVVSYQLGVRSESIYMISEMAHPTERQRHIREGILRGTTD